MIVVFVPRPHFAMAVPMSVYVVAFCVVVFSHGSFPYSFCKAYFVISLGCSCLARGVFFLLFFYVCSFFSIFRRLALISSYISIFDRLASIFSSTFFTLIDI